MISGAVGLHVKQIPPPPLSALQLVSLQESNWMQILERRWTAVDFICFFWVWLHVLWITEEKTIKPKHWPQSITVYTHTQNPHCARPPGGRDRGGFYSPYLLLNRIWTHSLNVLMSSVSRMNESHFSAKKKRKSGNSSFIQTPLILLQR